MDFNGRNTNLTQQQWELFRRLQQNHHATNSSSMRPPMSPAVIGSRPPAQYSNQQEWNLFQNQQMKLLQENKFMQQNHQESRPSMRPAIAPGMGAHRLTQYLHLQKHRPKDNNIEFWRQFVDEFFTPDAKMRWCLSFYGDSHQNRAVFTQDKWHCKICYHKPTRGFETTAEALPRLYKTKYDGGVLDELLCIDMPHECQNSYGQMVLHYEKAVEQTVFEKLRVFREGQLRIVFAPNLKICSWEFCVRRHEEAIPKSLIVPQVSQLGVAAKKCQAAAKEARLSSSAPNLQSICNRLFESAAQVYKTFEMPLLGDFGYSKKYIRCLQMAEVVNGMEYLVNYNQQTGTGPLEAYLKLNHRNLPALPRNINNEHYAYNNNAHNPGVDTSNGGSEDSNGNASTTTTLTTGNRPQQNSLGSNNGSSPDDGTPGSNDLSSQGSNSSPDSNDGDNKETNDVLNENRATGFVSWSTVSAAFTNKDDDQLEDFDDKFLNDHFDFDW